MTKQRYLKIAIMTVVLVLLLSCITVFAYSMNEAASSIAKLGYKTFSPRSTPTATQ